MAEFPQIGHQCTVETCRQLDFTPFCCDRCKHYFCGEHRFAHDCIQTTDESRIDQQQSTTTSITPLKPYLCSFENCKTAEHIKIVCRACQRNYCLSHRHCVDHKCPTNQLSESSNSRLNTNPTEVVIDLGVRKAESKVEQNKLDRIAMMRIKMQKSTDPSILETERLCLMVECGERGRYPVIFSKRWSIGRCIDQLVKMLKIERTADMTPQVYKEQNGALDLLNVDTTVDRLCKEGETIYLVENLNKK